MRYLEIDTGEPIGPVESWWDKWLSRIIPISNDELSSLWWKVRFWWLEIDDNGEALREIGFGADGMAIVIGPLDGRSGFLGDFNRDCLLSDAGDSLEASEKFDSVWNSVLPRFKHIEERSRAKQG